MKKSRASAFVEIQAVIFQPCKNVGAAQTPYGAKRCSVAFSRGKTGTARYSLRSGNGNGCIPKRFGERGGCRIDEAA